jgi:phosphoserine phosphatase
MSSLQPAFWPTYPVVIFDCDSTLAAVEGIDELAAIIEADTGGHLSGEPGGMAVKIAALTKRAMEGDLPLETVYGLRLTTINPTRAQVRQVAAIYRKNVIPDAQPVIAALQAAGARVFIVSGGLVEPVREFGEWLGIPTDQIYAVDMQYDQLAGQWWRYWEQHSSASPGSSFLAYQSGPLAGTHGKNRVISRIRAEHPGRALLVGDGLSDLEASSEVDLFIGFGGARHREIVAAEAPVFIHTPHLSPVLPLALGQISHTPQHSDLWADGLNRIYSGEVAFQEPALQAGFFNALRKPGSP